MQKQEFMCVKGIKQGYYVSKYMMESSGAEEKHGPNRQRQQTPKHSSKVLDIKHCFPLQKYVKRGRRKMIMI